MSFVTVPNKVQEAEIERMMVQYGDSLFRMCFLYLRDTGLAEDAVQDTFIKANKSFDQFRGESKERSWLMRIAINTCKDYHRTAWLRLVDRRTPLESLPEMPYEEEYDDSTVLTEIMHLPVKYKEVILLRFYQGMPLAEISETLSIPVQTVASRLKRAKDRLYTKLERWYFDEE